MSPKLDTLNEIMKILMSYLLKPDLDRARYGVFYILTFYGGLDIAT